MVVKALVGPSRGRFPVVSLDFSVTYSFRPFHGPEVDSAPSENDYQEHFLWIKAAGVWGWQPHYLHVPNVVKIWEPKPPGTLWVTPGLLRDSFIFSLKHLKGISRAWLRLVCHSVGSGSIKEPMPFTLVMEEVELGRGFLRILQLCLQLFLH